ncbi:MAG: phenylalanine--tRNA ligase subunit beta [Coriobacteriia bacterium]|nr:phenylalanine--tRNA ligase subunit beta [Coriobacteriia bacterium]
MKISLKWIDDYVKIDDSLEGLCDKLDLTGTGVEEITKLGEGFDKIVTAKIESKKPHPDSDHMFVTMVDVGEDEPLQIVCGAQNFEEGDHVVTALIGAVLQGEFKIKKSKLRGVNSYGMNCSEEELGLAEKSDGIMILPEDAPIGVPIAEYLCLSDTVIDTEITPNRPDCLSVVGCAREIAAIYDKDFYNPLDDMAAKLKTVPMDLPNVDIEDEERCPRYTARLIRGVKIGPSPKWLAERVTALGTRSINNVVDVTNYILYLFGQPLHTFDADKLEGDRNIIVRAANDGEKFTTLDGEERELNSDMTVIATRYHAIALAGVMGGQNSEIDENTTNVLLETATFSPAHTSRTSRKLGLISESSMRYERRVDDIDIDKISAAAAALIVEVAGGEASELVDAWPIKSKPHNLNFRYERFVRMMGADIPRDFVVSSLSRLGCKVDKDLSVETPTFRPDLEREIDLYEEVLRLWGMDKVESTLPSSSARVGHRSYEQRLRGFVNGVLTASGLNETVTYSFAEDGDEKSIELLNPMNAEQKYMRRSILPGLLKSVSYNINHGVENVALYEIGKVFKVGTEREKVSAVLSGKPHVDAWNKKAESFDFFDAKGIVENLLDKLKVQKIKFKPIEHELLQPGRAAEVLSKGTSIGIIGEVHPKICTAYEIDKSVACFELDMKALISCSSEFKDFDDIPVYPGVTIDVAFVVDDGVTDEIMKQRIRSAGGKLLYDVSLFDVYEDEKALGAGKKSLAYSLEYRDPDRTLTRDDVDAVHNKLINKVCASTGAEVRS